MVLEGKLQVLIQLASEKHKPCKSHIQDPMENDRPKRLLASIDWTQTLPKLHIAPLRPHLCDDRRFTSIVFRKKRFSF